MGIILDEGEDFHHVIVADDLPNRVFDVVEEGYGLLTKEEFLQKQEIDWYRTSLIQFGGQ